LMSRWMIQPDEGEGWTLGARPCTKKKKADLWWGVIVISVSLENPRTKGNTNRTPESGLRAPASNTRAVDGVGVGPRRGTRTAKGRSKKTACPGHPAG